MLVSHAYWWGFNPKMKQLKRKGGGVFNFLIRDHLELGMICTNFKVCANLNKAPYGSSNCEAVKI